MVFKGLQKDLIQQPEPNSRRQRQAAFFCAKLFGPEVILSDIQCLEMTLQLG